MNFNIQKEMRSMKMVRFIVSFYFVIQSVFLFFIYGFGITPQIMGILLFITSVVDMRCDNRLFKLFFLFVILVYLFIQLIGGMISYLFFRDRSATFIILLFCNLGLNVLAAFFYYRKRILKK